MFTIGTAVADESKWGSVQDSVNYGNELNQGGEELARYQRSIFNTFVAVLINRT